MTGAQSLSVRPRHALIGSLLATAVSCAGNDPLLLANLHVETGRAARRWRRGARPPAVGRGHRAGPLRRRRSRRWRPRRAGVVQQRGGGGGSGGAILLEGK